MKSSTYEINTDKYQIGDNERKYEQCCNMYTSQGHSSHFVCDKITDSRIGQSQTR